MSNSTTSSNSSQTSSQPAQNSAQSDGPKSTADNFAVGDWFSRVSYCQIKEVHDDKFVIENEAGHSWSISKNIVENECFAAKQFDSEKKVTATELSELLEGAGDTVFCVTFRKKPDINKVAIQLNGADLSTAAKRKKLAKELLAGEERTLVGYLIKADSAMGRCEVKDLEIARGEHALRLVDTRTIESIIIKRIKYVKK